MTGPFHTEFEAQIWPHAEGENLRSGSENLYLQAYSLDIEVHPL